MRLHQLLTLSLLIGVQGQTTSSNKTLKAEQNLGPKPHLVVFLANAKVIDHNDNQTDRNYVNPFQRMIQFFLSNILRDFTVDRNETSPTRDKKDIWTDIKEGTVNISNKAFNETKKGYDITKTAVENAVKDIKRSSDEERCMHGENGFCKSCTKKVDKRTADIAPLNETIKKRHYFLSISGDTDKRVAAAYPESHHVALSTHQTSSRFRRTPTASTMFSKFPIPETFNSDRRPGLPSPHSSPAGPARGSPRVSAVDSIPSRFTDQSPGIQTGHATPVRFTPEGSKFDSILSNPANHVPGVSVEGEPERFTINLKATNEDLSPIIYTIDSTNRESRKLASDETTTTVASILNASAKQNSRIRRNDTIPTNKKSTKAMLTASTSQQPQTLQTLQLAKTISTSSDNQQPIKQTRFEKALASVSKKLSHLLKSTNQISTPQKTKSTNQRLKSKEATPAKKQAANQKPHSAKALKEGPSIPARSTNHRPRHRRGDDDANPNLIPFVPFDFSRWYRNFARVEREDPLPMTPYEEPIEESIESENPESETTHSSAEGDENEEMDRGNEDKGNEDREIEDREMEVEEDADEDMEPLTESPLAPPNQIVRPKVKPEYSSFTYFLTVTLPTVIFFAAVIIGLCFVFRMNGVCCKMFLTIPSEEQNRPRRRLRVLRIKKKKKKENIIVANA